MTAALVVHPDGTLLEVRLTAPGRTSLELMREHLDCALVDVVALTDRLDMWLDDEGMYTKVVNPIATRLAARHGYTAQPYYGPVLLCSVNAAGDSIDLTRDQVVGTLIQLDDVAGDVGPAGAADSPGSDAGWSA